MLLELIPYILFYILVIFSFFLFLLYSQQLLFCRLSSGDDSDMKILEDIHQFPTQPEATGNVFSEYVEDRDNGNIEKAKTLGQELSSVLRDMDFEPFICAVDFSNSNVQVHLFLLCVFSIGNTLDFCFGKSNSILSQVAESALFEHLPSKHKLAYQDVRITGAYSMYILATRSYADDKSSLIGEAFAELCQQKDNPSYIDCGIRLYQVFSEQTKQVFSKYTFITKE